MAEDEGVAYYDGVKAVLCSPWAILAVPQFVLATGLVCSVVFAQIVVGIEGCEYAMSKALAHTTANVIVFAYAVAVAPYQCRRTRMAAVERVAVGAFMMALVSLRFPSDKGGHCLAGMRLAGVAVTYDLFMVALVGFTALNVAQCSTTAGSSRAAGGRVNRSAWREGEGQAEGDGEAGEEGERARHERGEQV